MSIFTYHLFSLFTWQNFFFSTCWWQKNPRGKLTHPNQGQELESWQTNHRSNWKQHFQQENVEKCSIRWRYILLIVYYPVNWLTILTLVQWNYINQPITQFGTYWQPTEFGVKTDSSPWWKEPLTTFSISLDLLCAISQLYSICHVSTSVSNAVHNDK